jgi:hypothetical protein
MMKHAKKTSRRGSGYRELAEHLNWWARTCCQEDSAVADPDMARELSALASKCQAKAEGMD